MNIIKYMIFACCLALIPALTFSTESVTAIFAGGCFWTMQSDFDQVPGVLKTTAGFAGGTVPNPTYEQVELGDTGHYESVQVIYDPAKTNYQELLEVYWHNTDPSDAQGQFCDMGSQYRPVIFYSNNSQKQLADASKQALLKSGRFPHIATAILPATNFYPAEAYHQEFYRTHATQYGLYKFGCGRDRELRRLWGN